jgi:hypothetical protein
MCPRRPIRQRDGADEVAFDAAVTDRDGALSGRISEPNTFGAPSVARLQATFVGSIDGTGLVEFTKTYDGTGGVGHSVRYIGHLDEEGLCVAGAWWIDETSGPFQMCRVGDAIS